MAATKQKSSFVKSAIYRIRVDGELDTSWSDILSEFQIKHEQDKNDKTTTILEGRVRDQAALSGVLNTLYDLHFTVLSVEYLGSDGND